MKRGLVTAFAAALIALPLSLGGTAPAQDRSGEPVTPAQAPTGTPLGQKLAKQVLAKKKFPRAVKAVQQVLALSGVATVREDEQIVAPTAPFSNWKLTAHETVRLARSVRNRQVQLGALAKALGDSGVMIGGRSATEALPEMVSEWMMNSDWQREEVHSQPGLFLWYAQSAKLGFNTRTLYEDPASMWLSSLEAIVIAANIERVLRPGAAPPEPVEEDPYYDGVSYDEEEYPRTTATASSDGPCGAAADRLEALGPIRGGVAQVAVTEGSGMALQKIGDRIRQGSGDDIGRFMSGLDLADRILRTAAFAEHVLVQVEPKGKGVKNGRVHKPMDDRLPVVFEGTVGLSKKARKELQEQLKWAEDHAFQQAIRKCAELTGVPIPQPYNQLAEEITGKPPKKSGWSAYWTLERPSPEGVQWKHPRRTKFEKVDVASAKTRFTITVPTETRKAHKPKYGFDPVIATQDAIVKMEVAAQKPPSPVAIGKFVWAVGSTLAAGKPQKLDDYVGPFAELAEGLFRTLSKPTGYGTLTIEEHAAHPCAGGASTGRAQASC